MIAMHLNEESLFGVLGAAARRRSSPGLALQLAGCLAVSVAIAVTAPQWWSLSLLFGAPAAYAAWGLLTHWSERQGNRHLFRTLAYGIALMGTMAAVAGSTGLALALFTGHGRSPYTPCGPGASSPMCKAWSKPPQGSGPIP